MYTSSIIWYLSWPVLIAVSTIIILQVVRKFDRKHPETT